MRRLERTLVAEYRSAIDRILADLSPDGLDDAVATAALAMDVRGYEDIKARRGNEFLAELRTPVLDESVADSTALAVYHSRLATLPPRSGDRSPV